MNETRQKIAKTSGLVAIVLKIGIIITTIGIGAVMIGLGVLVFADADVARSLHDAVMITNKGVPTTEIAISNMIPLVALLIVQLAMVFVVLLIIHRIFTTISREHTPFMVVNVKRMKQVAILLLVMESVEGTLGFIVQRVVTVQGLYNYSIDLTWVLIAGVIYCIALIFDYGCQLQQQSDETL